MLSAEERVEIAGAASQAFPVFEEMIRSYSRAVTMPECFAMGIYDATDGGAEYAQGGEMQQRAVVEFKMGEESWGERSYIGTAQTKARVALRTGRTTADLGKNSPELFKEGEIQSPGGIHGVIKGHPVVLGSSGLRGTEDEAFAQLLLDATKRLLGDVPARPAAPR